MKRHVINFVNNNIPVITLLNFDLFGININYFIFPNDLSFSTLISLSEKDVLILSRILHVYPKKKY